MSLALAAFTAALLLTACADSSGRPIGTGGTNEPEPAPAASSVRVTNHNWSLVVVYAAISGRRVRLGQVETGQTLTLTLPTAVQTTGDVELLAEPLASDVGYRSGRILIEPGAQIELVVENQITLSRVWVSGP